MTQTCDTSLSVCNSFGYDEFSRLTARTVTSGTVQNFTYGYDRYGNRWSQTPLQTGPPSNVIFNQGNNIISMSGYFNDAAGNIANDAHHGYLFDADGNVTSVDNGATATYYYDSLNERVREAPARGTYEFVWDVFGNRVSNWFASSHAFVASNAYTDTSPLAIRSGGQTQFEHQNWIGTERVRTTYNGAVALSISSLPWGDNTTPSGDTGDQHDFAGLDRDLEDNTEHAQYRQYSTNLGRWLSPDQYLGSYDFSNPQSFNRYAYVLNDPANLVDPSGLGGGDPFCGDDGNCPKPPSPGPGPVPGNPDPCFSCFDPGGGASGASGKPFHFKVTVYALWLAQFQLQRALLGDSISGGGGSGPSNGRNCSVAPASAGQYAAATAEVATLTAQYGSGLGTGNRSFGPGTATSAVLAQSAGVQEVLGAYLFTGQTSGLYSFGASGAYVAGGNPVAQFVGSFRYSISGGVLSITNTTSFRSLTYDHGPQYQRGSFPTPGSNTHQTYQIGVVCH